MKFSYFGIIILIENSNQSLFWRLGWGWLQVKSLQSNRSLPLGFDWRDWTCNQPHPSLQNRDWLLKYLIFWSCENAYLFPLAILTKTLYAFGNQKDERSNHLFKLINQNYFWSFYRFFAIKYDFTLKLIFASNKTSYACVESIDLCTSLNSRILFINLLKLFLNLANLKYKNHPLVLSRV